jgi:hypothetical protein
MDLKRKTCDIRTLEKHLFLYISSTNTDTLVPSLYQCVETRSIEVFWLLSQPLPHLVGHHLRLSNVLERISRPTCEPLYATHTSHREQETFLYEYPLHWVLLPTKKRTIERCSSVVVQSSNTLPFWLLKPASEHAHVRLLPRLSWSWTVRHISHKLTLKQTSVLPSQVILNI